MEQVIKCAFCGFEDPSACSENLHKVSKQSANSCAGMTSSYGVPTDVAEKRVQEFFSFGMCGGVGNNTPLEATLEARGSRYGEFKDNAWLAQYLKDVMRGSKNWCELDSFQREALDIIASKISRLLTGDPNYPDNWHDIQGFAKLVEDRLDK